MIDLPPLPEPEFPGDMNRLDWIDYARSYGEACARAALEAAAMVAEQTYEGSTPMSDGDSGMDFHGDNSAEAIRALKVTP